MTGQTESNPPSLVADAQDPLPESKWIWRRILAFGFVTFVGYEIHLAGNRIARLGEKEARAAIEALLSAFHWLSISWWVVLLLYLVAPSAEQVAKMLATLSAWKSGISTLATSRITTPSGTAETKTAAGPATATTPAPGSASATVAEPPENAPWG